MKTIKIKDRVIGINEPPLVIAEIGINHGGNLEVAKRMVDAAINAGCEVIKHQTHIVEDEMSAVAKLTIPGNSERSIYDIMQDCSLSESDEKELMMYVESRGAIFISTPFSRAAADRLYAFDVPAFKVGSGECNNYPLLRHISAFRKPIILSTGMNDIATIKGAVSIFEEFGVEYALMHTTNLYPTPASLVRLGALSDLRSEFPEVVIGLSDHTTSNLACLGAVALGASILERHFTDSMERTGPDIICSMDGRALSELIRDSRLMHLMRGGTKNVLLEEEQVTRNFAFSTVVTIKNVSKGEIFTRDNVWVKRPGIGEIPASQFESVLGRIANSDLPYGSHLNFSDIK